MNASAKPLNMVSSTPREPRVRELPCLRSADLFGDASEAVIVHHGKRYRLRCTPGGKLVLNAY